MSNKTANIFIRIEPEIKEQAEQVLASLGIPASLAVNLFYRQIAMHKKIPFEMSVPPMPRHLDLSQMTKEEFHASLDKGLEEARAGRFVPIEDIERKYGL